MLVPGSLCFNPDFDRTKLDMSCDGWEMSVWKFVPGADWKHPDGPGSSIEERLDHPVVHLNFDDVLAYCDWVGNGSPQKRSLNSQPETAAVRRSIPGERVHAGW